MKPSSEHLEWLMWHDRDVVLMNPAIPLNVFLPPEEGYGHVNIVIAKDRNGLNNRVFFCKGGSVGHEDVCECIEYEGV